MFRGLRVVCRRPCERECKANPNAAGCHPWRAASGPGEYPSAVAVVKTGPAGTDNFPIAVAVRLATTRLPRSRRDRGGIRPVKIRPTVRSKAIPHVSDTSAKWHSRPIAGLIPPAKHGQSDTAAGSKARDFEPNLTVATGSGSAAGQQSTRQNRRFDRNRLGSRRELTYRSGRCSRRLCPKVFASIRGGALASTQGWRPQRTTPWCNGSTSGSDPLSLGSSPSGVTVSTPRNGARSNSPATSVAWLLLCADRSSTIRSRRFGRTPAAVR